MSLKNSGMNFTPKVFGTQIFTEEHRLDLIDKSVVSVLICVHYPLREEDI